VIDLHVLPINPPQLLQCLQKHGECGLALRVVGQPNKDTDAPHALGSLRGGDRRISSRSAAEYPEEFTSPHSCPKPRDDGL